MRSFSTTIVTAALLLASSAVEAFVSPSVSTRPTQLNALEDLMGKVVEGSSGGSGVDMTTMDPTILMGGGAVLAVLAIGAAVAGSQEGGETTSPAPSPEPEPEPIDVSIPYDAAALYAYQQQVNKNGNYLDKEFQSFKEMYYDMSVAEVILKQKERKLQEIKEKMESLYPTNA